MASIMANESLRVTFLFAYRVGPRTNRLFFPITQHYRLLDHFSDILLLFGVKSTKKKKKKSMSTKIPTDFIPRESFSSRARWQQ